MSYDILHKLENILSKDDWDALKRRIGDLQSSEAALIARYRDAEIKALHHQVATLQRRLQSALDALQGWVA